MQKILITGGLGQVGSYLIDKLYDDNEITVLDNYSSTTKETVPEGVIVVRGDIQDRSVSKLVEKNDVIIHTAAQISVPFSMNEPLNDAQTNIVGTLNLLEASRNSNISKFIYISSAAVYGDTIYDPIDELHPQNPMSPYGVSKLSGEKYCLMYHEAFDLPSCCIRPFNIYSPRQKPENSYSGVISKFIEKAKMHASPSIFGDGLQTRDFISVHDIVDIILLSMKNKRANGHVFNAGTGESITIKDLANIINGVFNSQADIKYMPEREGDIKNSCADISKARNILGFKPKVSLEEGILEFKN